MKKIIFNLIRKFLKNYPPFNYSSPYTPLWKYKANRSISDFFLFRLDDYETVFIAENSLALLSAETVMCKHHFIFFNAIGVRCGEFIVNSDDIHYQLNITKEMVNNELFGGFIHQTHYQNSVLLKHKLIIGNLTIQHRGYTGYRKVIDISTIDNVFSFCHGNFGGMYLKAGKIKSLAKLRATHIYTPQVIFYPEQVYELAFLNPINKKITVKILITQEDKVKNILQVVNIEPFGSVIIKVEKNIYNTQYNLSWQTRLPIGRSIIFSHQKQGFDVFHS